MSEVPPALQMMANDDDGATAYGADPPGMYPSYRDEEANAMVAEQDSDEEIVERPRYRSRYIDYA